MKLFRRRKKSNKGFSLVEVVCAVAILGLTSTAIGSTMIMSTQNYQRGVSEVEVQQEGQLATTLINNLLVDATQASFDDSNKVLTIFCEGITYTVKYNAGTKKLEYVEELMDGTSSSGVLAEDVEDFRVDLSRFTDNRNAKVDLSFDKNGKTFDASSNTTARNGDAYNVGAEESAIIVCETDIVLEPNQTYHLDTELYGNPSDDTLVWKPLQGDFGSSYLQNESDDGADIYVAPDAIGPFSFVIETDAIDPVTNAPLDSKTVTVRVRRVNDLDYTKVTTGSEYMSGTTYKVYADITGTYLDKVIGKAYDNDYVNPRYVDFDVTTQGGTFTFTKTDVQDQGGRPYIEITLTSDMPRGSKLIVSMESQHTNGTKNKKSPMSYTPNQTAVCEIANEQGAIWSDSGIRRGNDNFVTFHFHDDVNREEVKTICGYSNIADVTNNSKYLYRYRKQGDPTSSQWFRMVQNNTSNQKFNADETWAWKAGYGYEIDVIFVVIEGIDGDNPVLKYPQDESLFNELKATYSNLTKGWGGTVNTPMAQYGGTLQVGAAMFKYPVGDGTFTESKNVTASVGSSVEFEFDGVNLCSQHYDAELNGQKVYNADVYLYDSATGAYLYVGDAFSNAVKSYFNIRYSNMNIYIESISSQASGKQFKIVPKMRDQYKDISEPALKSVPTFSEKKLGTEEYYLGEEVTGKGCIFVTVN